MSCGLSTDRLSEPKSVETALSKVSDINVRIRFTNCDFLASKERLTPVPSMPPSAKKSTPRKSTAKTPTSRKNPKRGAKDSAGPTSPEEDQGQEQQPRR